MAMPWTTSSTETLPTNPGTSKPMQRMIWNWIVVDVIHEYDMVYDALATFIKFFWFSVSNCLNHICQLLFIITVLGWKAHVSNHLLLVSSTVIQPTNTFSRAVVQLAGDLLDHVGRRGQVHNNHLPSSGHNWGGWYLWHSTIDGWVKVGILWVNIGYNRMDSTLKIGRQSNCSAQGLNLTLNLSSSAPHLGTGVVWSCHQGGLLVGSWPASRWQCSAWKTEPSGLHGLPVSLSHWNSIFAGPAKPLRS